MKHITTPFLLAVLMFSASRIGLQAEEISSNATNAILFGVAHSTVIISGKFEGTLAGGGGATSGIKVDQVFEAPVGFHYTNYLALYWRDNKHLGQQASHSTNLFLFFLQPDTTNYNTGFRDVTGMAHQFVEANEANVRFLKSQLQRAK
jgi:hypothetical protein